MSFELFSKKKCFLERLRRIFVVKDRMKFNSGLYRNNLKRCQIEVRYENR